MSLGTLPISPIERQGVRHNPYNGASSAPFSLVAAILARTSPLAFADVIWRIPAASGSVEGRQGARLHETDADSVRRDSRRDDGTRCARLRHDGQRQNDG